MMSSKMLSWIKKRCGRRPEKFDIIPNTVDEAKPTPSLSTSPGSPVYFTIQTSPLKQTDIEMKENSNDEVYEEIWKSSNISKQVTPNPSPELRVCPLCRSRISTDNSCKCVLLRRNVRSTRKPQPTNNDVSLYSLLQLTNNTELPHSSDDDSSGFYESVGSDSITSGEMYSDNSVATDSDDGYEDVEFRPSLGHRRRYSVGSLHTVLQRSKLHSSIRVGYKDRKFRRTMVRRSLKEKVVRTKVYIL